MVPMVTGNSNADYVTMYYDDKTDGTVPGRQEPEKVFPTGNGFQAVYHFGEQSGTVYDSTTNKINSTINNSNYDSAGDIGYARSFNGWSYNNYIEFPGTNAAINGVGGVTLSAWVYQIDGEYSTTQNIISKKIAGTATSGYELIMNSANEIIDFKTQASSMKIWDLSGGR